MKVYIDTPSQIIISKTYLILNFEVYNIMLIPSTSAIVQVYFYDDKGVRYQRDFLLIDTDTSKDYSNWQDDSYLYSYININFERIFNK